MKVLILITNFILVHIILFAQNEDYLIRTQLSNKKAIFKRNLIDNNENIIYKTTKDLVCRVKISPQNNYIAFLEHKKGIFEKGKYQVLPKNSLRIIDINGKTIVYTNDDVRRYVWCPDGTKIAYITGEFFLGGIGFISDKLYILDISSKKKYQVQNIKHPYDLHWLQTQNKNELYIKVVPSEKSNNRILRYDCNTRKVGNAGVKSIHFSPDGKYYVLYSGEALSEGSCNTPLQNGKTCFQIYNSHTNAIIDEFSHFDIGVPFGWVYNQGHFFMFTNNERKESKVYDVKQNQVVENYNIIPNKNTWGKWIVNNKSLVFEDHKLEKISNNVVIRNIPHTLSIKK
ncbi:MAG: hypothetical protein FVQ77_02630 [Cytophagales bacterium]|nr:hypothetical protein [Cytophagales bacterium]